MTTPTIGFIGLGLMGSAMAERLQARGYPLIVTAHRKRTAVDAAVARGATEVKSPGELASASDVVMICVDTSTAVESVMTGTDGVIAALAPGKLVIDFGTSQPGSTRALAAAVAERGAMMLDAPLGRTPVQARDGKLNVMVGGEPAVFARARPILDDLGENVFHVGPIGAGHTLKLINNFYAQTIAMAMSEAFAMADLADLDRGKLYEVMAAGPLHSGMMDFIKAYAVDGDPSRLAFTVTNAAKDVGYYTAMADDLGVPTLMAPGTKQTLALAESSGHADKHVPQVIDFFTELFANRPPPQ